MGRHAPEMKTSLCGPASVGGFLRLCAAQFRFSPNAS
jgi:hypothetical protein